MNMDSLKTIDITECDVKKIVEKVDFTFRQVQKAFSLWLHS